MIPEEMLDLASVVAAEVMSKCPFIDHADLMQEAHEWAWRNPTKLSEYMALEEQRDRDAVIATALRNRLRRTAEKAKASYYGYRYADVAYYSRKQIEDLLPLMFSPDDWVNPPMPDGSAGGGRAASLPSERGGWLAQLADVADAWRKLPQGHREVIAARFRDDWTLQQIADAQSAPLSTVAGWIEQAISRMHASLGGERPPYTEDEIRVGSRRSVSNAHAQAMTRAGYDGE